MKLIKKHFLTVFMVTCPVIYTLLGSNLREFQELFFQLMAVCLVALFLGNRWLSAFLVLNAVLFAYAGADIGMGQVFNVLMGCLIFMVARAHFKTNSFLDQSKVIIWVGVASIYWMSLQLYGIDPIYVGQNGAGQLLEGQQFNDPVGLFGIKMANGIFLSLVGACLCALNIFLVPFLLVPIFLCLSSVAVLSFLTAILFYTYHLHRRAFVWILAISLVAGAAYLVIDQKKDPKSFSSRFAVWHSAVKFSLKNPLGYGPDSYRNTNRVKDFVFGGDEEGRHAIIRTISPTEADFKYYDPNYAVMENGFKDTKPKNVQFWDNPHNEYIQLLIEYGFFGLILLIGLIREMVYRFRFATPDKELVLITACLLVYAVASITQFPMHLARLGCLFPILLGAFYARTDED